jgi:hypothetical protein
MGDVMPEHAWNPKPGRGDNLARQALITGSIVYHFKCSIGSVGLDEESPSRESIVHLSLVLPLAGFYTEVHLTRSIEKEHIHSFIHSSHSEAKGKNEPYNKLVGKQ